MKKEGVRDNFPCADFVGFRKATGSGQYTPSTPFTQQSRRFERVTRTVQIPQIEVRTKVFLYPSLDKESLG